MFKRVFRLDTMNCEWKFALIFMYYYLVSLM